MQDKIKIILAKASWCPHCIHFTPIFDLAKEKITKSKELLNSEILFESYDLDDENIKNKFMQEHKGLMDYLKGYPTVYFSLVEGNNQTPRTEFIEHTVVKDNTEKGLTEAVDEFINNIVNKYKSLKSGNKELHMSVQTGGMFNNITTMDEVNYRKKYLEYKFKYLKLKNNN